MDDRWLSLLQLCDSNFPTGGFSHSFGLETYVEAGIVKDRATFLLWLQTFVDKQLVPNDGLACRLAFEWMKDDQYSKLLLLDARLFAQNVPRETREGNRRMGQRAAWLARDIFGTPRVVRYADAIQRGEATGHVALVFALVGIDLDIEKSDVVLSVLYASTATLIQNGVRSIPLGQTEGQLLLRDMQAQLLSGTERVFALDQEELGAVPPGIEIAQMKHERLEGRMFMS